MPTPTAPTTPRTFSLVDLPEPAPDATPWIPPELRRVSFIVNLGGQEAAAKYGAYTVRMLRERFIMGQHVSPGDTVEVPGNAAVEMVRQIRCAVFVDTRQEKEQALLEEARRLNIPLDDSENPAFGQAPPVSPSTRRRGRNFVG